MNDILSKIDPWLVFGFFAQALFMVRFVIQWLASEYHKKSVTPIYFWYVSLAGSVAMIVYSWHIQDPVFLVGQIIVFFIYIRNIVLMRREQKTHDQML